MTSIIKATLSLFGPDDDYVDDYEDAEQEDAEQEDVEQVQGESDEDALRREYNEAIRGKYKDLYAEGTQQLINKRFRSARQVEQAYEAQQPIIDTLVAKYGISDRKDMQKLMQAINDDEAMWETSAELHGQSADVYRQSVENTVQKNKWDEYRQRSEQEQKLRGWREEGEKLKSEFPEFDFDAESENPDFVRAVVSGMDVRRAYIATHYDDIVQSASRKIRDDIRARGYRPKEAAARMRSSAASDARMDPSKLTGKQLDDIRRRVENGESISFG